MTQPDTAPKQPTAWPGDRWLELTARPGKDGYEILTSEICGQRRRIVDLTPAADPSPGLRGGEAQVHRVVALDVLEHVIDESAWLAAMVDVLEPGGVLVVRVPAEGPVAWLDAPNLVRYAQDITGWGKQSDEVRMKGWHRHYRTGDIVQLVRDAGLVVTGVERSGSPHVEVVNVGRLMVAGIAKGEVRQTNRDINNRGADARLRRFGLFSTKLTVWAIKPINQ